ncbi:WhiB family transcriptional regulator [Nonomuraea sp. NPDC047897]|uniref:WhiB family transcriptional regulator n=1 Tax=Nonomuraea sp. NPDC047897 TaxID=3364346 RepID=UPI0037102136
MSSHIVAPRHRYVTSEPDPERRAADRLRELDKLLLTSNALCRQPGTDPDDWFPIVENWTKYDEAYETAVKRCDGCPFTGLAGECVERARLLPYDPIGVIGGTDPKLRRQLGIGADLQGYGGVAA